MDRDALRRALRDDDELRIRRITRTPLLGALALADLHARRYDPEDPVALEVRHPAKPPHEQWMHAGKAKVAAKKAAAAIKAATQAADSPPPKTPRKKTPASRRRVQAITRTVAAENRAEVAAELSRQADLTPNSIRTLDAVHLPTRASTDGLEYLAGEHGQALAYYSPLGSRPSVYGTSAAPTDDPKPAIWLSPEWHGDQGRGSMSEAERDMQQSGYSAPTGADRPLAAVVAHEYGHHVTDVFLGPINIDGTADFRVDVGVRFLPVLNDALGADRYGGEYDTNRPDRDLLAPVMVGFADNLEEKISGAVLNTWVHRNRDVITDKVSGYGATNIQELLAEIWQEYSTKGDDARPHIRVIGDLMRELAEEARS